MSSSDFLPRAPPTPKPPSDSDLDANTEEKIPPKDRKDALTFGSEVDFDAPLIDRDVAKKAAAARKGRRVQFPLPEIVVSPTEDDEVDSGPSSEARNEGGATAAAAAAAVGRPRKLERRSTGLGPAATSAVALPANRRTSSSSTASSVSTTPTLSLDETTATFASNSTSTRQQLENLRLHQKLRKMLRDSVTRVEELAALEERNPTFRDYAKTYTKIHQRFCTCLESRDRLVARIEGLRKKHIHLNGSIRELKETSDLQMQTIECLEKEAGRGRSLIHDIKGEMRTARTEISQLVQECSYLDSFYANDLERRRKEFTAREDAAKRHLRDNVIRQREMIEKFVTELADQEKCLLAKLEKAQNEDDRMNAEVRLLEERLKGIDVAVTTEQSRISENRECLQETKDRSAQIAAETHTFEVALKSSRQRLANQDESLRKHRDMMKLKKGELDMKREQERQQKAKRDRCVTLTAKLETEHEQLAGEIAAVNGTIDDLSRKTTRAEMRRLRMVQRRKNLLLLRDRTIQEKDKLQSNLDSLRGSADRTRMECDALDQEIEDCRHQKSALIQQIARKGKNRASHETEMTLLATQERNIFQTVANCRIDAERDRREIYLLEDGVAEFRNQAHEVSDRCETAQRQKEILELSKTNFETQISQLELQLKNARNRAEEVRNDRNSFRNKLEKLELYTRDQTRRFKILSTHIQTVKEEIAQRERRRAEKGTEEVAIAEETTNVRTLKQRVDDAVEKQRIEVRKRMKSIQELHLVCSQSKENLLRQQREVSLLINERDVLGNRLLSRNEELTRLYDAMKANQKKINSGKAEFDERSEELELLQSRSETVQKRIDEIKDVLLTRAPLSREVNSLRDALLREKMKLTALVEESNVCLNVHAFRLLENTNPEMLQVVSGVSQAQKDLCRLQEELHRVDALIKEKELLYHELKKVISKQPGRESVDGELKLLRVSVVKKRRQIATLKRDLVAMGNQVESEKQLNSFLMGEFRKVSNLYREKFEGVDEE